MLLPRGELFRGNCLGGKSSWGNSPRGISWGAIVKGVVVQGAIVTELLLRPVASAFSNKFEKRCCRLVYNVDVAFVTCVLFIYLLLIMTSDFLLKIE